MLGKLADLAVAVVWRPVAWDVPLTAPWGDRRVFSGRWSDQARRWVRY